MSHARKYTLSLQHVFAGERLQAFSDAVFSIIITFIAISLNVSKAANSEKSIESFLVGTTMLVRYLVYLFSYAMVLDSWFIHVAIFSIIEQVDGVILMLNLFCLLFISFLPFANLLITEASVNSGSDTETMAIALCSTDLAAIGFIMALMLIYAYWRQKLLHPEVMSNAEIRTIQKASIIAILVKPLIAVVALILSLATSNTLISMVIFYSNAVIVLGVRLAFYLYFKKCKRTIDRLPRHLFKTIASKFRIEFFSDGVFAIVATLIVLDITNESVTKLETQDDIVKFLKEERYVILSYVIHFTIVGLLWYIHYTMLHFIKKLTPGLTVINFVIIFLVGAIPSVSQLDARLSALNFIGSKKHSSVAVLSVVVFFIGLAQMLFWTYAIYKRKKCMSKEVEHYNSEFLQFCKVLVLPCISILTYYCSLSNQFITYHLYGLFFLSTPLIYIMLDFSFRVHGRCQEKLKRKTANRNSSSIDPESVETPYQQHSYQNVRFAPSSSLQYGRPRSCALTEQVADYSSSIPPGTSYGVSSSYGASTSYNTEHSLNMGFSRNKLS